METKEVTHQEALHALNVLVMSFIEDGTIDTASLAIAEYATTTDVLFRDYLMGMPTDYGTQHLINLSDKLLEDLDEGSHFAVMLNTLKASWLYEQGEIEKGDTALTNALKGYVTYSLAQLLVRATQSGYAQEVCTGNREKIHPKVVAEIKSKLDEKVLPPNYKK